MFSPFAGMFKAPPRSEAPALPIAKGPRPRVGLALGGGAARGWAHIGVLQRLAEDGIIPDVIAGTSIGAVAGGCYAAGKLPELEEFAKSLTPRRVLGLLDLTLGAPGLIGGRKLGDMLTTHLQGMRIEKLKHRFVAVTTEIGSGHEVWLTRGPIVSAIEASYALPGVFPPIKVGGRWLIDGAFVNPVPISVCRTADVDVVIGVSLHWDSHGRGSVITSHGDDDTAEDDLVQEAADKSPRALRRQLVGTQGAGAPGLTTVIGDAFNITQDRISRARLAGDPPDVMIVPRLPKVGLFDFHKAAESIVAGREAAERALDDIHASIEVLTT